MPKGMLFLFLIFSATTLFAQKNKHAQRLYFPWDSLFYKNEVSLDISPVIAGIIAGDFSETESFGVLYRRYCNKRNVIRSGYRLSSGSSAYDNITSLGYETIAPGRTDSILLVSSKTQVYEWNRWHTLRTGYEHRFGKRRVKYILGFDVLLGIEEWERTEHVFTYRTIMPFDSSGMQVTFNPSIYFPAVPTDGHRVLSFILGVAPLAGISIDLTKRWSLSGLIMIDNFGIFPFKHSDVVAEIEHPKQYQLVSGAFMADLSVGFHF